MPTPRFVAWAILAFTLLMPAALVHAENTAKSPVTVLVTGANRGIGLEFARQYAERGYRVIATARKPERAEELIALQKQHPSLVIEQLDVTDFARIDALAEKYRGQSIDILVNNAGITGDPDKTQVFGKIDYDAFDLVMRVNTLAPLKMAEAFIDHVERSEQKKIITVSSSMGSIAQTFGTGYFYRSSKSAVNMIMRSLSIDLRRRGIIFGMVNPGPTDTDMMAALSERGAKLRDPAEATADMIRNIDGLTKKTNGAFLQYDGKPLPW